MMITVGRVLTGGGWMLGRVMGEVPCHAWSPTQKLKQLIASTPRLTGTSNTMLSSSPNASLAAKALIRLVLGHEGVGEGPHAGLPPCHGGANTTLRNRLSVSATPTRESQIYFLVFNGVNGKRFGDFQGFTRAHRMCRHRHLLVWLCC